jgi:DNA-binding GntR family transcriptional regulator
VSASDSLARLKTDTLGDQVHAALRNAVLEGRLGAGERVTERDLAARLDVSPTPVREALRQLVQEHVFERTGPRSLRVAEYESTTLAEIAEMEALLCGLAVRFASRKATVALVEELSSLLDQTDRLAGEIRQRPSQAAKAVKTAFVLLREFHHRIEDAADNPILAGLLKQSRAFTSEERFGLTMQNWGRAAPVIQERYLQHRELLKAVASGDEVGAERLATAHHLASLRGLARLASE